MACMTWWCLSGRSARVDPRTRTTLLRDFVRKRVKDKRVAAKILRAENLTHDMFEAPENKGGIITARATGDGTTYRIHVGINPGHRIQACDHFLALIRPWDDDGTHTFFGESGLWAGLAIPDTRGRTEARLHAGR